MTFPRIPPKEFEILRLLGSSSQEWYGLELVKASAGAIRRGTVYVLLDRLEEKGLVTSRKQQQQREDRMTSLRLYKITALGQRVLHAMEAADMAFAGSAHATGR